MILSDTDILARLDAGDLKIDPTPPDALQPASIELHLGRQFLGYANPERIIQVDPTDPDRPQMRPAVPDEDGSILLTPLFLGGHLCSQRHSLGQAKILGVIMQPSYLWM